MQELYFGNPKNVLSARFWYQYTARDLPGSTLYGYAGEKQSDESLRSLINYNVLEKADRNISRLLAWMSTKLNYDK